MYIKVNAIDYPCTCNPRRIWPVRFIGEGPETVSGVIGLYADNGFELRSDDCADYLRTVYDAVAGTLTLTNTPEPEPIPEPEPVDPTPSAEEDMDALLVDHEYRLTLLELGLTE